MLWSSKCTNIGRYLTLRMKALTLRHHAKLWSGIHLMHNYLACHKDFQSPESHFLSCQQEWFCRPITTRTVLEKNCVHIWQPKPRQTMLHAVKIQCPCPNDSRMHLSLLKHYFKPNILKIYTFVISEFKAWRLAIQHRSLIDLMHWRHVSITTTPCWGSRLVALRARVLLEEHWRSQPLSQCAGPGRPGGMACRGWPTGCMLGDSARESASFDPQQAGATLLWRHMHKVYSILLCYIAECGLSGSSGQAHNLTIWTVTSDLPWTPSHVRCAHWTRSVHIQQNGAWKAIGGVSNETLISVPQTC